MAMRLEVGPVCISFKIPTSFLIQTSGTFKLYTPVQWNLFISGFSLYQDKKTKKYKELAPAKLPCYKRILFCSDLVMRFHCIGKVYIF